MIIYTKNITPRLEYTVRFIFKQLGINYIISNNLEYFFNSDDIKLNYSNEQLESSFHILPQGLLFETDISNEKPEFLFDKKLPVIYAQKQGNLGFDIFSAVFWFLSRYEEYQEFNADYHGRFPATESLLFKNNLHEMPIVDQWLKYFKSELAIYFPNIAYQEQTFKHLTTIDVDSPWCYKHKGVKRNLGGLIRDVLKINLEAVLVRVKVLAGLQNDPWNKFEWLKELEKNIGLNIKYFVHVGDHGTYDKTVSYKKVAFQKMLDFLKGTNRIALHPSYVAHNNKLIFNEELKRLSELTNTEITESRQHFLVFGLYEYYLMLINLGISDDYSMGFADKAGFRAGTSQSFKFFDLKKNEETKLSVHPFVMMDRTLNSYENKKPEQATEKIKRLIDTVKETNGTFISLWHNESLSNIFEWKGWQNVFVEMQNYLSD